MTKTQLDELIAVGFKTAKDLTHFDLYSTTKAYLKDKLGRDLTDEEIEYCYNLNKEQQLLAIKEAKRCIDNFVRGYTCQGCNRYYIEHKGYCKTCLYVKEQGIADLEEFYNYAQGFNNATLDEIVAYYKERIKLNGGL